jgi:3-deoxy-7-phosphoheptulonate synthase
MTNHMPLAALRAELDSIDDAILVLVDRRLAAASAIARAKAGEGGQRLALRPRRQAEIVGRLQGQAAHASSEAVADIWRELMAHSLQAQRRTEIVLAPGVDAEALEGPLRRRYGSAMPVSKAATLAEALAAARTGDAIAILPAPLEDDALTLFDRIEDGNGTPLAWCAGRVAAEDWLQPPTLAPACGPASWRRLKAAQMPAWPDAAVLARVEDTLAGAEPVVTLPSILALKSALADVAEGRSVLLHGGDCAESFAEFGAEKVGETHRLLLDMAGTIGPASGKDVVRLARIAGQFAKPRSELMETRDGVTLPAYRGDAVNGADFTHAARTPDPERLLRAHRQSRATSHLLGGLDAVAGAGRTWTSHEALLLNNEQALTRFDLAGGRWWGGSGHLLWIGDRTRQLDGAHVDYAAGIANPIGLKCGTTMGADELRLLCDRLDPENEAGRLVLIGRFGAGAIGRHLPRLMRATKGRNVVWAIDPMHGNGRVSGGIKTRCLEDILAETRAFLDIAASERVHAGGIHLELTGGDVAECIGGGVKEADLALRYRSLCDPRLNRSQALELAGEVAARLAGRALAA